MDLEEMPFGLVVRELAPIIGVKATAALAGETHTDSVRAWMNGGFPRDLLQEARLRATLKALRHITVAEGIGVAKTWFFSSNPHLGDCVPAHLMRDSASAADWIRVQRAARTLAAV